MGQVWSSSHVAVKGHYFHFLARRLRFKVLSVCCLAAASCWWQHARSPEQALLRLCVLSVGDELLAVELLDILELELQLLHLSRVVTTASFQLCRCRRATHPAHTLAPRASPHRGPEQRDDLRHG
jgi:hypothetical protein